jgi:hypothetical protein
MVDMYEAPVHIGQRLDLVLKILSDIVRSPERHLGRKDDIDLDKVVGSRVVYSAGIDFLDFLGKSHCLWMWMSARGKAGTNATLSDSPCT